jgi:hypothetical protein
MTKRPSYPENLLEKTDSSTMWCSWILFLFFVLLSLNIFLTLQTFLQSVVHRLCALGRSGFPACGDFPYLLSKKNETEASDSRREGSQNANCGG